MALRQLPEVIVWSMALRRVVFSCVRLKRKSERPVARAELATYVSQFKLT